MPPIDALVREAAALANGGAPAPGDVNADALNVDEAEVGRQMHICNACRYCEGFCAMFPAMTRRLEFGRADIHYLANLCHNCGACLHACQYAPPHEFAVNVPRAMARVRGRTYHDYAWPRPLGALYRRNGLTLSLALAAALALFLVLAMSVNRTLWSGVLDGNFYNLFPHGLMVAMFAPVFLFALLALALGVCRFWRDVTPATTGAPASADSVAEATGAVLSLKYLEGGHGEGCNEEDDAFTLSRQRWHHFTFYGFMLCFASTTVATLYHYTLGLPAPYAWPAVPKLLGVVGGVSLMVGTAGLWRLHRRRNPLHKEPSQNTMDLGFIALLFLTSASGLALWLGRSTPALALLLCLHLGAVMAFFLTLPYSKFAHGTFRSAALLRYAIEKRQPRALGADIE